MESASWTAGTVLAHSVRVARWKCSRCDLTSTDLPDFLFALRRYAHPCLVELAEEYFEHDDKWHQHVVTPDNLARHHVNPANQ